MSDVVWHDISEWNPEEEALYLVRKVEVTRATGEEYVSWELAYWTGVDSVCASEVFIRGMDGLWAWGNRYYTATLTHFAHITEPEA